MTDLTTSETDAASSVTKILHWVVGLLLIAGGLGYWYLKPAGLNPMADPRAAEAMALVQTHRAKKATTVLQALNKRVQAMEARGQGVRLGEWTVQQAGTDRYVVRVWVREKGSRQWFEREYQWQVNLGTRTVVAITTAAEDLMPRELLRPNPFLPDAESG